MAKKRFDGAEEGLPNLTTFEQEKGHTALCLDVMGFQLTRSASPSTRGKAERPFFTVTKTRHLPHAHSWARGINKNFPESSRWESKEHIALLGLWKPRDWRIPSLCRWEGSLSLCKNQIPLSPRDERESHTPIQHLGSSRLKPPPPTSSLVSLLDILILLTSTGDLTSQCALNYHLSHRGYNRASPSRRILSGLHWSEAVASFPILFLSFLNLLLQTPLPLSSG